MDNRPIIKVRNVSGDFETNDYLAAGWELFAAFPHAGFPVANYCVVRRGDPSRKPGSPQEKLSEIADLVADRRYASASDYQLREAILSILSPERDEHPGSL